MNIYNYFQNEAGAYPLVPGKNQRLWKWAIFQTKRFMLSRSECSACLKWAKDRLQDDESLDCKAFQADFMNKVRAYSSHRLRKEFCDFPLIVLIFEVCLNDIYYLMVNDHAAWMFSFSLGTLIRCIGIYMIIKITLGFMAREIKRSAFLFWLGLSVLFFGYLWVQSIARSMERIVFFSMPIGLWILVAVIFWVISFVWVRKQINR